MELRSTRPTRPTRRLTASRRLLVMAVGWLAGCSSGGPDAADPARQRAAFSVAAALRHDQALHRAHDVELQGELAFVPGKGGALAIVDIADPSDPKLVWHRRDPAALGDAETVLPAGERLYLGTDDFHSIDISRPASPRFDAAVSDPRRIRRINGMVRLGDRVLAANKAGWVNVFDVSDPREPQLAAAVEARDRWELEAPHDIDLLGTLIVIVDPNGFGRQDRPGRLAVLRGFGADGGLLEPDGWELVGLLEAAGLAGANRVQVVGSHAYVASSLTPEASGGVARAKGSVIDLADPARPRQLATVDFADVRGPNGLTVSGKVWFLAGGQTIEAYDVSDPSAPRRLASFRSEEAFPTANDNAHDLVYRDGHLYVSAQGDNAFVTLRVEDAEIARLANGAAR